VTGDDALRITNVTIQMGRNGRTLKIEARVSNPNGFDGAGLVAIRMRDRRSVRPGGPALREGSGLAGLSDQLCVMLRP
jgi:hypothetical protein